MPRFTKHQITSKLVQSFLQNYENPISFLNEYSAVQIDPVNLVSPNHHLVLGARIKDYKPQDLETLLENKKIIEVIAKERCFVKTEDFPLYYPKMLKFREKNKEFFENHKSTVNRILKEINTNGPMSPRMFEGNSLNTKEIWSARKDTTQILEYLWWGGFITVAKRKGNEKFYNLTENFVPKEIFNIQLPESELKRISVEKYLSCMKVTDINDIRIGFGNVTPKERREIIYELLTEQKLKLIEIANVKKKYIVWSEFDLEKDLDSETYPPTLLPPLDNFVWRRERLEDLWDFVYRWEIYTPQTKRKVGPYGMVLVANNTILGQSDVRFDRKEETLYLSLGNQLPNIDSKYFKINLKEAGVKLSKQIEAKKLRLN